MENLSFLTFVLISFPDQIVVFLFGTLAIGKFNYFKDHKNYFKLFITFSLMTLLSFVTREVFGINFENTIFSLLFFILLLTYVLNFKFYESITASVFGFFILVLVEIPSSILLSNLLGIKGEQDLYNNISKLFIWVSVIRSIQVLVIFILIRYKLKILDLEKSSIKKKEYYLKIVVYLISIVTFAFLILIMARALVFSTDISSSNITLLKINICITILINIVLIIAVKGTHNYYKNKSDLNNNEVIQSIEYINSLINQQNYSEAKDALENLKTHITKN
ncbi:UNVERIFIED_CONTAM: hypothetical protein Cloal_1180 [Acetivibrio alkalicellulosi]